LAEHAGVTVEEGGGRQLLVRGLDASAVGRIAYVAGVELQWLAERDGDLEQLFFSLTDAGARQGSRAAEVGV